jgi:uncharacterized protein with FMN-binding domain
MRYSSCMEQSNNSLTPKIVGAVAISAVLLIGIYVLVIDKKPNTNSTAATTSQTASTTSDTSSSAAAPQTTSSTPSTSATVSNATYKDGTYNASATYSVPREYTNSIKVTLTVKDGKITNVTTNSQTDDRESEAYISDFESSVSSAVVGKSLANLSANRIGGASLTTEGFNEALQQIQSNAKT